MSSLFRVEEWRIGCTEDLRARVTAGDGAGAATGIDGEGNYVTTAQVSAIACRVYDRSSATPDAVIATPAITSAAITTVDTTNVVWTLDGGHNFKYRLQMVDAGVIVVGAIYRIAFQVTLTTGTVIKWAYEATAVDVAPVAS